MSLALFFLFLRYRICYIMRNRLVMCEWKEKRGQINMKIISFGSMNIDKVYQVENFVLPGETVLAKGAQVNVGGKGLNQSVAAARAGIPVIHAGAVGEDGAILVDFMEKAGVETSQILHLPEQSGVAMIEVEKSGRNRIIVYGGTNQMLTESYIDRVLAELGEQGDIVLLQNEVNLVSYIIQKAHECGLRVAFNPSPIPEDLESIPLEYVDYFIVNEVEGAAIAGIQSEQPDYRIVLQTLSEKYPSAVIVLTLGSEGVLCKAQGNCYAHGIYKVKAVDTTAAGDTFCGYFLAGICQGKTIDQCLESASAASAIAVSRAGAAPSIPQRSEVEQFISDGV